MNKKVQRRQARVRHARREEILQAGRQWSLEPVPKPETGKVSREPDGAGNSPPKKRHRDLR